MPCAGGSARDGRGEKVGDGAKVQEQVAHGVPPKRSVDSAVCGWRTAT